MKVSILFVRFPFGGVEHYTSTNWMIKTIHECKKDPRISEVFHKEIDDTPITMSRNLAIKLALSMRADLICMIDSDMYPDLPYPDAKPFFPTALDFLLGHSGPAAIAAPYCGAPPIENVFVFQLGTRETDDPNSSDILLEQFSREDAACRGGIQQVSALPTGLYLLDMRAIPLIAPPWFEYEYTDPPFNTKKATTEDVFFTRNCTLAGVPQYVLWDSWAGHWKRKCVGKPLPLTNDQVIERYRSAIVSGHNVAEKLCMIGEGEPTTSRRNGRIDHSARKMKS